MTNIWKLENGNYLRRRATPGLHPFPFVEMELTGNTVTVHNTVPADAVPMVPATGRQVTGQDLFEARCGEESLWKHLNGYRRKKWNDAAERLNLLVREREPRQPWDVLREAAGLLTANNKDGAFDALALADNLEDAAEEKSQRDREIAAVADALRDLHGKSKSWDHQATVALDALDAVRGEQ